MPILQVLCRCPCEVFTAICGTPLLVDGQFVGVLFTPVGRT